MDIKNNNLNECFKQLSPFAIKVFMTFIKLKNEHNNCNIKPDQRERLQCKNKKITTVFNDALTSLNKYASDKDNDNVSDGVLYTIQQTPYISTSSDLILPINNNVSENTMDFIETTSINSINLEGKESAVALNNSVINKTQYVNKHDCVDWNDLIDNDLFCGFNDSVNSNNVNSEQNDSVNNNTNDKNMCSDIHLANEDIILDTSIRRKHSIENTDTVKLKKSKSNSLPNYRKEKYTKSVKNWLNNIDPNISSASIDEMGDKNKKTKSKNIIQSRLANKGGVMKYAKPKCKAASSKTEINNTDTEFIDVNKNNKHQQLQNDSHIVKPSKTTSNLGLVNKKNINDAMVLNGESCKRSNLNSKTCNIKWVAEMHNIKTKDAKKLKSKFIAPIQSPLPVKHMSYTIHELHNMNITEYSKTMDILSHNEVVMVLMYSNGFSQLNAQYSTTDRTAAAIMFSISEHYYYVNNFDKEFTHMICNVITRNTLICFEAKELLLFLMSRCRISSCSLDIVDAKVGGNLLSPADPPETFSDLQKLLNQTQEFTIADDCVLQKCAWYMSLLRVCTPKLCLLLTDGGLWKLFSEIEMKVLPIIAEMEHRGVCVDLDYLKYLESILLSRIREVEVLCYEAAGKSFQINSAQQVRAILYEELRLDTRCNVKIRQTICKAKSTSEAMLRSLTSEHPLPKLILEYRHLHKAHATFLAGILPLVQDGVVRPTWDQTAAVTGRIACNNPNLQAIPRAPFSLILFPEDNQTEGKVVQFRDAYAARTGRTLLAADFKHAECRVFALAAYDDQLQRALRSADLFRVLAANWLHKSEETVTSEERERTKRIVYASLYGAGARRLAELLRVSYEQALCVLASFNSYVSRTFPSLKSFGRSVVAKCEQGAGRLSTPGGRARSFPNIFSQDIAAKAQAERQAINFIIQGSAADLCKAAMVATEEQLRRCEPPVDAQLLLQIHDELVWEVLDEHLDRAAGVVQAAMEGSGGRCGLAARFPAGLSVGARWGSLRPYMPPNSDPPTEILH